MNDKKRFIVISSLLILSLITIVTVVSVAFFSYAKDGSTENKIETGTIEFHYDEISKKGHGISLIDALPTDSNNSEKTNNTYFEFNVTSKTTTRPISYIVTAQKSSDSDDIDGIVDLYLTDNNDTALFDGIHRYNSLVQYRNRPATEKVIYTDTVPANQSNFRKDFRLRMWIDESIDFSGVEETTYYCSGVEVALDSEAYNNCAAANLTSTTDMVYQYNDKTFKITVNVYTEPNIDGYAVSNTPTLASVVTGLSEDSNNTSMISDDPDGNPRYVGANPDNYVYYNCTTTDPTQMNSNTCEVWRIIGVFDGRIKLIRNEELGRYAYDTKDSPYGYGYNEWSQSELMQELNGDYLDTTLTTDPMWTTSAGNVPSTASFDHTKVLNSNAQNLIADATWYLGSPTNNNGTEEARTSVVGASTVYNRERSEYTGFICSPSAYECNNDQVQRTDSWNGKVGLMYLSDFMYATAGSTSGVPRNVCLDTIPVGSWTSDMSCATENWLNFGGVDQMLISPFAYANYANQVCEASSGHFEISNVKYSRMIRPVVFLKSNVKLVDGNGASTNPYKLGL